MKTNLYTVTVPLFAKHLMILGELLEKAEAHAGEEEEVVRLVDAKLAEDMFSLGRQIELATDTAKGAASRLSRKDMPRFADGDHAIETLKGRLRDTLAYFATISESDFDGEEDRLIELPFYQGKALSAFDYVTGFVLPNFYFHVTIAYAILRKEGVPLGKLDYLGSLPFVDFPA